MSFSKIRYSLRLYMNRIITRTKYRKLREHQYFQKTIFLYEFIQSLYEATLKYFSYLVLFALAGMKLKQLITS